MFDVTSILKHWDERRHMRKVVPLAKSQKRLKKWVKD